MDPTLLLDQYPIESLHALLDAFRAQIKSAEADLAFTKARTEAIKAELVRRVDQTPLDPTDVEYIKGL